MLKRRGAKNDPSGTLFLRHHSLFGLLSPVVRAKLLFPDHSDHELARQKSQQLASEAMVPDSVISSCQIHKHDIGLLFCLKRNLNVLS